MEQNSIGYAYISGPLSAMSETLRVIMRKFYEQLGDLCRECGIERYVPHLVSDPTLAADLTPLQVYNLDRNAVVGSTIVLAYVGRAALGTGAEIEMAKNANIPVILIYEKNLPPERRVSRLTRGSPNIIAECVFTSNDNEGDLMNNELAEMLKTILHKFVKERASAAAA